MRQEAAKKEHALSTSCTHVGLGQLKARAKRRSDLPSKSKGSSFIIATSNEAQLSGPCNQTRLQILQTDAKLISISSRRGIMAVSPETSLIELLFLFNQDYLLDNEAKSALRLCNSRLKSLVDANLTWAVVPAADLPLSSNINGLPNLRKGLECVIENEYSKATAWVWGIRSWRAMMGVLEVLFQLTAS